MRTNAFNRDIPITSSSLSTTGNAELRLKLNNYCIY